MEEIDKLGAESGSDFPDFTYTGQYAPLIDDGKEEGIQNWRLKLLTTGILTFNKDPGNLDVFLVGGGGGNSSDNSAGGGGGYTKTIGYKPVVGEAYEIVIGDGGSVDADGGQSTAFGAESDGGKYPSGGSTASDGADGGSGGGGGDHSVSDYTHKGGQGGSDGGDGATSPTSSGNVGGKGQGVTTREFGASVTKAYIVGETPMASDWLSLSEGGAVLVPSGGIVYSVMTDGEYWYKDYVWNGASYVETDIARVYAGGGGGGGKSGGAKGGAGGGGAGGKDANITAENGAANTGGGAGGKPFKASKQPASGGSGIIIIRNHRS